ncbi:hypothetical protein WQ54_00670 [Bacillus sp. SA1-12]|uniref:PCYCGC motif-containing (lipo)protein n=1 Tax=Bacillus sp. SA1-12 TaxID=1455638 RepID=UPI0006250D24|nr:PCYCGC motif-containing (lipo)protein [Bacillus sp. SA1-12]KKI94086.1 hypothetical protein WQ54_00670 [Bacillus sp. SA1-12]
MNVKILFISLLITIIISACSGKEKVDEKEDEHTTHQEHVIHDIREETKNSDEMPKFLKDKPEDMQVLYLAAAKNRELLEKIPCYCGCGETANHKNNYDCFVYENKENGAVVWDDHGTKCGVCLEIAAQSILDYQDGKSIKEIRSNIDTMYKEGYAKPTPTPEV